MTCEAKEIVCASVAALVVCMAFYLGLVTHAERVFAELERGRVCAIERRVLVTRSMVMAAEVKDVNERWRSMINAPRAEGVANVKKEDVFLGSRPLRAGFESGVQAMREKQGGGN